MSNVMLVGGPDSGNYHRWFGHRVRINRVNYVQHRAWFKDGTHRDYYVVPGINISGMFDELTLHRIEVRG